MYKTKQKTKTKQKNVRFNL